MAQIVVEQSETRRLSNSGGKMSGSRSFVVWDDTTPITEPHTIRFDGTTGMPNAGDLFPGETELYALTYSIAPLERSGGVWKVDWAYTPTGGGSVPDKQPEDIGYLQVSFVFGGGFRDAYRTGPNVSATGSDNIGGTPIDCAGVPTSVFVPQHTLTLTETVAATSVLQRASIVRTFVATRNLSVFYGAAAGSLLYMGCSGSRVSLVAYSLTHNFIYDPWEHKIQQPKRNQFGVVQLAAAIFTVAEFVRWVQPFPTKTNFNKLSENF